MKMVIMPVANGILPRPHGGRITGIFLRDQAGKILSDAGPGRDIFVCPWITDEQSLYPVGIVARIIDIQEDTMADETGTETSFLTVVLEGQVHARWHSLQIHGNYVESSDIELLHFQTMRKEYPVISGAGWVPRGGYTEFCGETDIPVTIYGIDLETSREVSITANLGGLVGKEQAHTIEHAMIRALSTYGLCTARTMMESLVKETTELKQSLEFSIRHTMPEALGITASGICGNPLTNMAQFYLAQEFVDNIKAGKKLNDSLANARRATMSQLTSDMGLSMQQGLRTLQGLKKGMSHDDSMLKMNTYKKVIQRFPFDPWG
ncbi:MAG: hypothetical protein H6Q66_1681 [Firmicutes bacterium]|nr:hypothetical protein [Bacillota bacterium]